MSRKRKNKDKITSKDIRSKGVVPSLPQKHHEDICEEDKQLFLDAVDSLEGSLGDLLMEKFDFFETQPTIRHKIRHKKKSPLRKSGEQIKTILDLHGFNRKEAVDRIEQFCRLSARRGISNITVITGRGIHSQSRKSVLKQEIIRWLNSEDGRKLVESYRPGFPYQGGEGVLILYLR
jgi:DNA-nicking Smr family endonuclease